MIATFTIHLATEPHSQRWNKILISEYDFVVNVIMAIGIAIHDMVNKLLIAKIFAANFKFSMV